MTEPTHITSRDNPLVKELRRLAQDGAAYRKTSRLWLEGEHLCEAAHLRGWQAEIAVISDQYPHLALMEYAQNAIKKIILSDAIMRSISGLESSSGIGLVIALPRDEVIAEGARTVVLDRLQDPGNVGSILRSAAAFGFQQIIALKGTVALWSPKVLRAGMGAHFSLKLIEGAGLDDVRGLKQPLAVTSSHRGLFLHQLQSHADLLLNNEHSAHDLSGLEANLALNLASVNWVLGHEGQGVCAELEALAALHVRIAQPGGQESLNVAAAAAICLHASAAVIASSRASLTAL
jgi:RNA methyltransferase, TrmH family